MAFLFRRESDGSLTPLAGGTGGAAGVALGTPLSVPQGIAITSTNNIDVAESTGHRISLITPGGAISTYAGNGTAGYQLFAAPGTSRLNTPAHLALDAAGNQFIADALNDAIREVLAP